MANFEDMGSDRRRRLELVRTEIEKYIAAGRTPAAGEWVQRYPDLNPELGELLALLTEEQEAATPKESATSPVEDLGATVTAFGVSPGSGQSRAASGSAVVDSPTQTDFRTPEERSSAASASRIAARGGAAAGVAAALRG